MKKVLIVDDDHAILEAMQLAIEDEGYLVKTIADGNMVMAQTKKYNPDIILLDLLLSGKDGAEVISLLRKYKTTQDIPVVLLSAHPSAEETAKKCGADGFLAKPFDVDNLLETIKKHIR